jgi:hypothetical protein
MIAITVDTDWAPVEIVQSTIELIKSYGCKVTLFCTNALEAAADEIAIHPHFTDVSDLRAPVRELKRAFPQARGTRSHSLFFTERLRPVYSEYGLVYDSNAIQYLRPQIECSLAARRTVSMPLYFMDRFHLEMASEKSDKFSIDQFHWDDEGLKVFDFHPIHVFLNTSSVEWYERAKHCYHEPSRLRDYVAGGEGVQTLLKETLSYIERNRLHTYTMSEIGAAYYPEFFEGEIDAGSGSRE